MRFFSKSLYDQRGFALLGPLIGAKLSTQSRTLCFKFTVRKAFFKWTTSHRTQVKEKPLRVRVPPLVLCAGALLFTKPDSRCQFHSPPSRGGSMAVIRRGEETKSKLSGWFMISCERKRVAITPPVSHSPKIWRTRPVDVVQGLHPESSRPKSVAALHTHSAVRHCTVAQSLGAAVIHN